MTLWVLGVGVACGAIAWGTNFLALIPWRRAQEAHWTERARLLFPVRSAARANLYLMPINGMLAVRLLAPDSTAWAIVGFVIWLGVVIAAWPIDRETMPWLAWRDWRREVAFAWIFTFARWFVLLGAMLAVPDTIEWSTWLAAAAVVGFQALLVWGGAVWLNRRLGLLKDAPESLRAIVRTVAERAGISVRGVWTLRSAFANAMALPHTRDLAFTERTLEHFPPDELAAICSHEIGHLAESKRVRFCRFLGTLAWVPWVFLRPLSNLHGPLAFVALGLVTWTVFRLMGHMSQKWEQRADAAARQQEVDEGAFARALARLYELNQVPAVIKGRGHSHPQLYDRLLAAGVTPDYPRPKPAEVLGWPATFQSGVLGILITLTLLDSMALF